MQDWRAGPGWRADLFVDYNDQYADFNYLEAAPMGWGNAITVNQGGLTGETSGSATVDPLMKWCSNTSSLLGLDAWANSAVGVGGSNTSTADTTCAGGAIQAVSDYAGGTKTDWFLPSVGEAMLMYTNLRQGVLVVLLLAPIGVRLRPTRTTRGSRPSTTGTRPTAVRRPQTTCVQCGLFNYLTIHLFVFGAPSAARTQEKYF